MNEPDDGALHELADAIARRRLIAPTRLVLDIIEPFGFLASQMALFAQPFVPGQRWRRYVGALTNETSWDTLHALMEQSPDQQSEDS